MKLSIKQAFQAGMGTVMALSPFASNQVLGNPNDVADAQLDDLNAPEMQFDAGDAADAAAAYDDGSGKVAIVISVGSALREHLAKQGLDYRATEEFFEKRLYAAGIPECKGFAFAGPQEATGVVFHYFGMPYISPQTNKEVFPFQAAASMSPSIKFDWENKKGAIERGLARPVVAMIDQPNVN